MIGLYPEEKVNLLNADDNLNETGIDSIVFIQLLVSLEEEYDIVFEDEMLDREVLPNVTSIIDCVEKLLEKY